MEMATWDRRWQPRQRMIAQDSCNTEGTESLGMACGRIVAGAVQRASPTASLGIAALHELSPREWMFAKGSAEDRRMLIQSLFASLPWPFGTEPRKTPDPRPRASVVSTWPRPYEARGLGFIA
ncbi:hypothetical protein GGTG_02144 [Gaeumannomyces tritici R3-111a-1]|uniref:Uncharacterized protein n=1 Tax=Gaeumannomyces tritici (strain R3-111a-1) TaxID=644352 RepID=J3NLJ5_GAET3|nr:hypothetical protein GGTG_02144 [Gaeumannomyces tritici R3-111a-1]EJT82170.1 hypothetical protein GGTG_02144 [Gaeumannomyces tritici R3-111a-1]